LPGLSYFCSPVLAVLCWQSCSGSPVLLVLSLYLVLPVPFKLYCSSCLTGLPFLAVFSFLVLPKLSFLCSPVLAALSWQPYPGSPILAAQSWQFCPGSCPRSPVMEVSFCLSHSGCPVLFWLSKPVRAIPFCCVLSCLFCSVCLFCLSCSSSPVLPVLFCLHVLLIQLLPVLFCLSCSACPVQPVLLSYPILPVCPVLPVLFCLSVRFCLSCSVCHVSACPVLLSFPLVLFGLPCLPVLLCLSVLPV
jgi:hypothetical protein